MAPLDPRDPFVWSDWAGQWQSAQRSWSDWWQKSFAMPPQLPQAGEPRARTAEVTEIHERFQERLAGLWRAALALKPGAGKLPELVGETAGDRRFSAAAWREQPY